MGELLFGCGIGPAFEVIGGKWKVAILCELHGGTLRFGELKRRLTGISEKMLIQHLRDMERDQLVTRTLHHQVPPRVDYALTGWGIELNDALGDIARWGERYARATGRHPTAMVDGEAEDPSSPPAVAG